MRLVLNINMDNSAFEYPEAETVRILNELKQKILIDGIAYGSVWKLRDINGNTVGDCKITGTEVKR